MTINHKAGSSSALFGGRASNQSTRISCSTSGCKTFLGSAILVSRILWGLLDLRPIIFNTSSGKMMKQQNNTRVKVTAQSVISADGTSSNPNHYDHLLPNPCGSTSSDTAKRKANKFVKRKYPFSINTFNTRLVLKNSRKLELVTHTSKFKIDVICLQEHRIIHKDEIAKESLYESFLLTRSATKNSVSAAVGGVGFLLSRRGMNSLINVEKINERVAILTPEGNPRTTIINCYSPTNISSETEIESFYQTPSHKSLPITWL